MALTVEDGSNVLNANSYVSVEDARAYANARGLLLPPVPEVGVDPLEALLMVAMDYLEVKRDQYIGTKSNSDQALQWPRKNVRIDGVDFPVDKIPAELIASQVRLAAVAYSGVDIMPTQSGAFAIRETIGPLTTEYSEKLSVIQPIITAVDALLKPLLSKRSAFLTTIRV